MIFFGFTMVLAMCWWFSLVLQLDWQGFDGFLCSGGFFGFTIVLASVVLFSLGQKYDLEYYVFIN